MSLQSVLAPLKGMKVTMRHAAKEPRITVQYPEQKLELSSRLRGLHELRLKPDGTEVCVGCSLCAAACPADCILVEGSEEEAGRERFAKTYKINLSRCIFCGFCVEACPVDAIGMTKVMVELTFEDRWSAIWDKEMLVANFKRRVALEAAERVPEAA
ncbi:MAG TPA: NADH-quinone oxidoreductase subunit NuoI [Armatimonadota bacterium]|jgi:NADH-quinone oxidoreductase subunit I